MGTERSECGRASTNTPPDRYLEALAMKAFASNFDLSLPRLILYLNRGHTG
jgi:hypothetical protein